MKEGNGALAALGLALAISALACATLLAGRSGGSHELDRVSEELVEAAQVGNPRAIRALELAIRYKPVGYSEHLFAALRSQCNDRCDGLEGLMLTSFDRIARAGRLAEAWPDRKHEPLRPKYRRSGREGLMVGVESGAGKLRGYLDPAVARVLVGNLGVGSSNARSLYDVARLPEVGQALCALRTPANERSELTAVRRGFCAASGSPSGDIDTLCKEAMASTSSPQLAALSEAERQAIVTMCNSLGPASSSSALLPPSLATFVGPACFEVEEAQLEAGIHADLGDDADLLQASLDCMGLSAEPSRPSGGSMGERLSFFDSTDDRGPSEPGEWVKPTPDGRGWSYRYDVTDARSNAENSAHVGEPGYVAVFAIEPAPGATGAVSVVATNIDGDIAQIIVEFAVDPDEVDFQVLHETILAIRAAVEAAIVAADASSAARAARETHQPSPSGSASPSDDPSPSPSESSSPSPSESDSPSPSESTTPTPAPSSTDAESRAFAGPSSKSEACQAMASIVRAGPGGVPRRGPPGTTRPPVDPRTTQPRPDEEREQALSCGADRTPRVCAAADCGGGLHLDPVACSCTRSRPAAADLAHGCMTTRCTDGSHGEAIGPGCVCISDDSARMSRPLSRGISTERGERGWGVRAGRL